MMQQPAYQQETGSQDPAGQQQMVLCPVRLVYETQMLVQPGDQIQPNQTILINPQNTPPWIQNRPVQNQVIYVQQVPTNYLPSPQQQIDQNQVYIQNYGFHNVPQMFMQNPRDQIRQLQMVPNMIPNIQPNINTMQNPRMLSNVAQVPNSLNIVNTSQNQNIVMNRQVAPNQINYNEIMNKSQEDVTQNIYRNPIPQTLQQDTRFPNQPTIAMVPSTVQPMQRAPQPLDPNVNQIRHMQQNIQQAYPNTVFNIDERGKVTHPINKGNNLNIVHPVGPVRNSPQLYRPIQPRTNQVKNNATQLPPMQAPQQSNNFVQSPIPNTVNIKSVPRNVHLNNSIPTSNNLNNVLNNMKVEGNNMLFNRKRKSESPDEIHKKVSISNQTENFIAIKQPQNITYNKCTDVGVNTSPVHKVSNRITINSLQITPLNPNVPNSKLKEELAKPIRSSPPVTEPQNTVKNMISIVPSQTVSDAQSTDKEKLVRNTVYVQARGRVLTDKESIPEAIKTDTIKNNLDTNITGTPLKEVNQDNVDNTSNKNNEIKQVISKEVKKEVSKDLLDQKRSEEENKKIKEEDVINENNEKIDEVQSNEDVKVKEDKGFVLTHVLGGFVIQESNVAFPIRRPLKERTLQSNTDESKKENKDLSSDRHLTNDIKDNSKIFNISHLNLKECENMETGTEISKMTDQIDNPFESLKPSNVKLWTAEQLAEHLSKFQWNDTVSVLQEHELDGESLLLVSKGQLLTIGVKEEHADIISDFVKS